MQEFILHHLWIILPLAFLAWLEYIPFTSILWNNVGLKIKRLGEKFLKEYENKIYPSKEKWAETSTKKIKIQNFFVRVLFFAAATVVVIFLEIFWELGFKKTSKKLQQSKFAKWFELQVESMNKYFVLVLFGVPFIAMEALGIVAAGFLLTGHIWIFLSLYAIKFLFFIPVHFVLHVGEKKLMDIPWFARRYRAIVALLEWFKKSETYTRVHNFMENIGSYVRGFKNLFTNSVINMDKAFKGEDLLSPECEALRLGVEAMKKPTKADYKKVFDCITNHLNDLKNSKKKEDGHE